MTFYKYGGTGKTGGHSKNNNKRDSGNSLQNIFQVCMILWGKDRTKLSLTL